MGDLTGCIVDVQLSPGAMRQSVDRQIDFLPSQILSVRYQAAINGCPPREPLEAHGVDCKFNLANYGTLMSVSLSLRRSQSNQWLSGAFADSHVTSGSYITLLQSKQPGKDVSSILPRSPPPSGRVSPVGMPARMSKETITPLDQELFQPYPNMSSPGVDVIDERNLLTPTETNSRYSTGLSLLEVESSPSGTFYANINYGDRVQHVRQEDTSDEELNPLLPLSGRSLSDSTRNPDYGITTHQSKNSRSILNRSSSEARKRNIIYRRRGSRELRQIASQHATSIIESLDEPDLIDLPNLQHFMTKEASRLTMSEETPSSTAKDEVAPRATTEEITAVAVAEDDQSLRQGIEALDLGNGTEHTVGFL